jgi:hypothetical protein
MKLSRQLEESDALEQSRTLLFLIMGLYILLGVLSRLISKTALRNEYSRCFYLYSLSRHVSAYLMAILR